jgi:hypothetical protein
MSLWVLEQIAPWRSQRPGTVTNANIVRLVVRAPNEDTARELAGVHGILAPEVRPGEEVPDFDSPFLRAEDATCERLGPDGPDEVIAAQTR